MNFIRRILFQTAKTTTKLGRWQLHYDPKVVHSKVDQANEDHCGCCHEPVQHQHQRQALKKEKMLHQKQKWQEKQLRHYTQKQLQKYSESEEYYVPYVL